MSQRDRINRMLHEAEATTIARPGREVLLKETFESVLKPMFVFVHEISSRCPAIAIPRKAYVRNLGKKDFLKFT